MNFKRSIRFWWQRRTRGWDDSDTWNLEAELARWLAPRLRRFIEAHNGVPLSYCEFEGDKVTNDKEAAAAWDADLEKMAATFEWYGGDNQGEAEPAHIKEGWDLFVKHYRSLWW